VWEGIQSRMVTSAPVKLEHTTVTEVASVNTEKACQVGLLLDLETLSVKESEDKFESDKMNYEARYEFPVTFKVLDEQGKEIHAEETAAAWDRGTRSYEKQDVTRGKGALIVEHDFSKFDVPEPGRIKVEIKVMPDGKFKAVAGNLEVRLYDDVARHTRTVLGGVASFLLGPVIVGIGILVFIVGLAFDTKK
jgi:hypothetical protein